MKLDEFIEKSFDWYYEENIHNTNISNMDAVELFKETDIYLKYKNNEL